MPRWLSPEEVIDTIGLPVPFQYFHMLNLMLCINLLISGYQNDASKLKRSVPEGSKRGPWRVDIMHFKLHVVVGGWVFLRHACSENCIV